MFDLQLQDLVVCEGKTLSVLQYRSILARFLTKDWYRELLEALHSIQQGEFYLPTTTSQRGLRMPAVVSQAAATGGDSGGRFRKLW